MTIIGIPILIVAAKCDTFRNDHTQPLFVWTGKDTFDKIGPPQGVNKHSNFIMTDGRPRSRPSSPPKTVWGIPPEKIHAHRRGGTQTPNG